MKMIRTVSLALLILVPCLNANAGQIFFASAGANTVTAGATTQTGDLVGAYSGTGTTTQAATVEAYAKPGGPHNGFELNFVTAPGGGVLTHNFAITVTNEVGQGTAVPAQLPAVGDEIQNIEFEIVGSGGSVSFTNFGLGTPLGSFTSSGTGPGAESAFFYTNGAGNQVLRFGGHAGGGPAIAQNASRTFNFSIDAGDVPVGDTWSLRVIANPEPATMFLGGLALLPAAGFAIRRRRLMKAAEAQTAVI